jgi:hypothetical protein
MLHAPMRYAARAWQHACCALASHHPPAEVPVAVHEVSHDLYIPPRAGQCPIGVACVHTHLVLEERVALEAGLLGRNALAPGAHVLAARLHHDGRPAGRDRRRRDEGGSQRQEKSDEESAKHGEIFSTVIFKLVFKRWKFACLPACRVICVQWRTEQGGIQDDEGGGPDLHCHCRDCANSHHTKDGLRVHLLAYLCVYVCWHFLIT